MEFKIVIVVFATLGTFQIYTANGTRDHTNNGDAAVEVAVEDAKTGTKAQYLMPQAWNKVNCSFRGRPSIITISSNSTRLITYLTFNNQVAPTSIMTKNATWGENWFAFDYFTPYCHSDDLILCSVLHPNSSLYTSNGRFPLVDLGHASILTSNGTRDCHTPGSDDRVVTKNGEPFTCLVQGMTKLEKTDVSGDGCVLEGPIEEKMNKTTCLFDVSYSVRCADTSVACSVWTHGVQQSCSLKPTGAAGRLSMEVTLMIAFTVFLRGLVWGL